jgi:hypothetical protein
MQPPKWTQFLSGLLLILSTGAGAAQVAPPLNDYPTIARADYIFGCMAVNGQDRDSLSRCACSIDVIATILPYDSYVAAETVMSMRLGGGERAALFRGTPSSTAIIAELRRAQAEAEIICF